MDIGTLTGKIELEDQMSAVLTKVDTLLERFGDTAEKQMTRAQSSMTLAAGVGSFMGNVLAKVGIEAFTWGKNIVENSLMAGARLEQLGVATRFLGERAGYTNQFIDDLAASIEKSGIDGISSREAIVQLLNAHIDLANASKLSAIAQNMQSISGRTSSEVFETMTRAMATGNTELLRNIGFQNVSINSLTRASNAATGHTGAINGAARSTLIMNAILAEGAEKAGLYAESMTTAGKQASSAERAWDQVSQQIGTVLLPVTSVAIKAWYSLGSAVRDSVMESQGAVKGGMQAISEALQNAITKVGDLASVAIPALMRATFEAGRVLVDYKDVLETVTFAMGAYLAVSAGVKAWMLIQPYLSGLVTAALYVQAFGWEAVALGVNMVVGPIGLVTAALTFMFAAWKIGNIKAVSDTFEYWGLRAQGVSDELAHLTINSRNAGEAAAKTAPPVKDTAKALSEQEAAARKAALALEAENAQLDAYDKKLTDTVGSITLAAESRNLAVDAFNKTTAAMRMTTEAQSVLIPLMDKQVAAGHELTKSQREYYETVIVSRANQLTANDALLKANGVTLERINLLKAQGLSEAEIAVKLNTTIEAYKRYENELNTLKGVTNELADLQVKMSGTATDAAVAAHAREYQEAVKSLDKTSAYYAQTMSKLAALRQAKDDAEGSSWSTLAGKSKEALQQVADAYQRDLDRMIYGTLHFTHDQIQEQIDKTREAREAAKGMGDAYVSAADRAAAATKEHNKELEKTKAIADAAAAAANRAMGNTQEVTSQNFEAKLKQVITNGGFNPTGAGSNIDTVRAFRYASQGYSFQEILDIFAREKSGSRGPLPPPQGPRIPGFADGGLVRVGERGPEVLRVPFGSQIYPSERLAGDTYNVVMHVNGTGEQVARQFKERLMREQRLRGQLPARMGK